MIQKKMTNTTNKNEKLLEIVKKLKPQEAEKFAIGNLKKEINKINRSVVENTSKNDAELAKINKQILNATTAYKSELVNFRKLWDKTIEDTNINIKKVDGSIQSKALDIFNNKRRRFYTNGFQIANTYPSINFIPDPAAQGVTITSRNNPATETTDLFFGFNLTIPNVRWMKETPDGDIDGSNVTYELTRTPLTNSLDLVLNGQILTEGVDYTISGTTITMIVTIPAIASGKPFIAKYMY